MVRTPVARALLGVVVLTAALIRLPALLFDGLWRDQANLYVQATAPTFAEFFSRTISTEWHPPLFPLISLATVRLFGTGEFSFTFVPYLCSLAWVVSTYWLGTNLRDRKTGLLAAGLFACSTFVASTSTDYVYPLFGLLVTTLAAISVRTTRADIDRVEYVGLAIVTSLTVYTHYAALIVVPPIAAFAILFAKNLGARMAVVTAFIVGMATFVFWMPIFLGQRAVGIPYVVPPTPTRSVSIFVDDLLTLSPAASPFFQSVCVVLAAVMIVSAIRGERTTRAHDLRYVALGGVVLLALVGLASLNLVEPRYAVALTAIADVVVAYAFVQLVGDRAWPVASRWGLSSAAVLVALVVVHGEVVKARVPRSGLRTFSSTVGFRSDTLYVVAPSYLGATMGFYVRDHAVVMRGFTQYERPDIFRLAKSIALWRDPAAVAIATRKIDREAIHFSFVDLVRETIVRDAARMPYGKVDEFERVLAVHHRFLGCDRFPGRLEDVTVCRYAGGIKI